MLICLGGVFGSGRTMLAKKLAAEKNLHYYSINERKFRVHVRDQAGKVRDYVQQPETDEQRLILYKRAIRDLPMLAKMHDHVVVDSGFLRKESRNYLLAETKPLFTHVVLVWIDSPDEWATRRFEQMRATGILGSIGEAEKRRAAGKEIFQELPPGTAHFVHTTSDKADIEALWRLIETHVAQ